ncbi:MAG: S8 family serine peptidase [bacterium]|nr:S8 family serine peptidase [bacterium]
MNTSAFAAVPNDPFFGEQWYVQKLNLPGVWDYTTGSAEVIVVVIDTVVDIDHPDLRRNIWRNPNEIEGDGIDNDRNGFVDDINGWNFVERTNDPRPQTTGPHSQAGLIHGTLLAGIIAAVGNNAEGVAGINWRSSIMPIRSLDSEGSGTTDRIVAGIDYAVRNGADIINLSFTTFDTIPSLTEAIRRAKDAGVLVVAAAGNDDSTNLDVKPAYPVCTDGPAGENWVVGVAAVSNGDTKSSFSNHGSQCIDISAPGENIFGTQFSSPQAGNLSLYGGNWAGTSVATPMVSGVAALIKAMAPNLNRLQVIDVLKRSAINIDAVNPNFRGLLGKGRVDALAAVQRALTVVPQRVGGTFAVAAETGAPRVWLLDDQGSLVSVFLAYAEAFRGGVRVAMGDTDGDTIPEIITGAGPSGGPHIRVFNMDGSVKAQFFAFDAGFRGGVTVASADFDRNGKAEIVIGAGKNLAPWVRVFDGTGKLKSEFLAYAPTFTGGVEVTTGDIDGDGIPEIITGAGPGGGPHVRVFSDVGVLKGQFFVFENTYRGGVRLGAGDTDGDGKVELVAVRGTGPEVRVFSAGGTPVSSFTAFTPGQTVGIGLATFDRDHDGKKEIMVAASNSVTELRGFTPFGSLVSVFALPPELNGILRLAAF